MARVVALIPDLLFGSQVQGMLTAAGHEVELVGDETAYGTGSGTLPRWPAILVVDLTNDDGWSGARGSALS